MFNKIIQKSKYLVYALVSIVAYGVILYFVFTWLAGYSPLYAYLGNLALIILVLAIDEYMIKMLQSKEYIAQLRKKKDAEKNYHVIQQSLNNIVSFKTELYLFYIFILIATQITEFYPTLVGENISNFILANSHSILFLIAFDMLMEQFSNDKERIKKTSAKFKKYFDRIQD